MTDHAPQARPVEMRRHTAFEDLPPADLRAMLCAYVYRLDYLRRLRAGAVEPGPFDRRYRANPKLLDATIAILEDHITTITEILGR